MEARRLKACVQKIAEHYTRFADQKADYEAQVFAEINQLENDGEWRMTGQEKRNIKKAGEALAKDKLKDLRGDVISLADIIEVVESA